MAVDIKQMTNLRLKINQLEREKKQSKDDIERLILETKQPKEYLTPNETAKLLHVNRSTLYQWNKNGYLRVIEVGGKRLYRQSDIDAILNRILNEKRF